MCGGSSGSRDYEQVVAMYAVTYTFCPYLTKMRPLFMPCFTQIGHQCVPFEINKDGKVGSNV